MQKVTYFSQDERIERKKRKCILQALRSLSVATPTDASCQKFNWKALAVASDFWNVCSSSRVVISRGAKVRAA